VTVRSEEKEEGATPGYGEEGKTKEDVGPGVGEEEKKPQKKKGASG